MPKKLKFNSLAIHGGQKPDASTGAVMTPIYQTSTYAQTAPGQHKGFEYSRSQNPTRQALEKSIASLEGANHGLAFGSGLAAIDALLKILEPGDEVIATRDLYGGTYRLFTTQFQKFGIDFTFVDMQDAAAVRQAAGSQTKLIWVETPTNPMMQIIDIAAMAEIAKQANALLVVDNTFATPYLQQPLALGADVAMHSATKYLGGHSDLVLGTLAAKDKALAQKLYAIQNSSGAVCGPMDAFLTLRGIKTLHVRMQRHCENGRAVAHFLKNHPQVDAVYWPGLEDHPGFAIAQRQMKNFGGMVSFRVKGDSFKAASEVVSALRVFTLAESLGGVESLAGHPASMTHAAMPEAERKKNGITDGLIRLSVGLEDQQDLTQDLEQALAKIA
jgi:cystathionine beta-lyase